MIRDMAFFTLMLFAIAFAFVTAYILLDDVNAAYQDMPQLDAEGKALMSGFHTRYPTVFDFTFLTLFLAALTGVIGLVWFLDINPIVFFVLLFIVTLLASVAGYFANAWIDITDGSVFSAAVTNFPITNFLISNYMVLIGVFGFLALIVFAAKPGRSL